MKNHYEQLVEQHGAEKAKQYMRDIRAKVKTSGLANLNQEQRREVARKGWATRREKDSQSKSKTGRLESIQ